jgi:hypothetical protein
MAYIGAFFVCVRGRSSFPAMACSYGGLAQYRMRNASAADVREGLGELVLVWSGDSVVACCV